VADRTVWLGAVAYDPKVVTIWEGMRRFFREDAGLPIEIVLFQTYEAQVAALLAERGEIGRIVLGKAPGARALHEELDCVGADLDAAPERALDAAGAMGPEDHLSTIRG